MARITYPSTLPGPQPGSFAPRPRRAAASIEGLLQQRARQRDTAGLASQYMYVYTPAEMASWREWYRDTLLDGRRWFAADLPGRAGMAPHVVRYRQVQMQMLGAGIYRVSASFEQRGASLMPCTSYIQEVLADSPLVFWILDEGHDSTVGADSGSLGLPLTLNPARTVLGSPSLSGVGTSAEILDAGPNPAESAHADALNFGAGDFTLTALVKTTSHTGSLVSKSRINVNFGNWILGLASSGQLSLQLLTVNSAAAGTVFTGSSTVNDNMLHRVVARREGDVITLMDNDTTVHTGVYSGTLWACPTGVGVGCSLWSAGANPGYSLTPGLIACVAIWDGAVPNDRLHAHFEALA